MSFDSMSKIFSGEIKIVDKGKLCVMLVSIESTQGHHM
jgi:hypothetical protein